MPRFSVLLSEKASGKQEKRLVESTSEARVIAEMSAKGYSVESIEPSPDNFLGLDLPDPAAPLITYHVTGKSKATGMRMEFTHKAPDEYALADDLFGKYEVESCRVLDTSQGAVLGIYHLLIIGFLVMSLVWSCQAFVSHQDAQRAIERLNDY